MKKYYFINKFDTNIIDKLDKQTIVIYRNYSLQEQNQNLIFSISQYCKKKKIKFYLSNNIKLAIKLNLDGVYLPSFNKSLKHLAYSFKKNFKIIGSAHNFKQIKIKEKQNVEDIFISSLFKKNKNYLGVNKFKSLIKLTQKNVIALGGISKNNIKVLNNLQISGFAGISFFE
jgi:thiamine-phosphate pyrophosphorylase